MTYTRCLWRTTSQEAMIEGTREEVTEPVPAGDNGGRDQAGCCGGMRSGQILGSC